MNGARGELMCRALQHRARGCDAYQQGDLQASRRSLGQASRIAAAIGAEGEGIDDDARFWLGAVLHAQGRVAEALAAWAPAINRVGGSVLHRARYMAMTRYVLVAVDIPLPLGRIESAFAEVEGCLRTAAGGLEGRRSRLLLARARLALFRGRGPDAVALAQESVAYGLTEGAVYNACSYYRTLVLACLAAGDLDLARSTIETWEATPTHYPDSKRILIATSWSSYFRNLGDARRSLDVILPHEPEIRTCQDLYVQIGGGAALVRACVAAGCPERARATLARLAKNRRCALGEARFDVRLLVLDYHLSRGGAEDGSRSVGGERASRAERAIVLARREAVRLDELLCCDRHMEEVERRVAARGEDQP